MEYIKAIPIPISGSNEDIDPEKIRYFDFFSEIEATRSLLPINEKSSEVRRGQKIL